MFTFVPPAVLQQLAAPLMIVAGVVTIWIASQFAHRQDPLAAKRQLENTVGKG